MSDFVFFEARNQTRANGNCDMCDVWKYIIFGVSYSVIKYVFYIENPVFHDASFDFRGSSISLRETLMPDLTQDCVM